MTTETDPNTETRDPTAAHAGAPVPVTVLTGFLGAGKTTVLNHLVKQPGMARAAVIVNEFGEVGLDHMLVEKILGDAVLLDSGCLCCSVRGDLVDTMTVLRRRAEAGDIPVFDRLLVETTGLADPAPVLQTVMTDGLLTDRYRLHGLVTVVDAVNAPAQLDAFPASVKQVALASRLLLTKTDISPATETAALVRRLHRLNPVAPLSRVADGKAGPDAVFGGADYDPADASAGGLGWLDETAAGERSPSRDREAAHDHDHAHTDGIRSFCLSRADPIPWRALRLWLDSLTSLRGADLLRVKGIVNVVERDRPVVLHGVQHVFHPPRLLDAWPGGDRRSRIVCITRGLTAADLGSALDAAVENLRN